MFVAYRVSLSPLALHPREVQFSAATADVLVDTPVSQLGDQREDGQLNKVIHLSITYGLLLKTGAARLVAARAAGIPGKEISVSGPFNFLIGRTNHPVVGPQIANPVPVDSDYRLVVDVDGRHPMVSLYAQAPTTRAAVAIVDSMRTFLIRSVAGQEAKFALPTLFRGVVRPLGATTGGVVDPGARIQLLGFVFCLVFALGGSLLLARRRRRLHGPARLALGQLGDGSADGDNWPHTRRPLPWAIAGFVAMLFLVPVDAISLPIHLPLNSKPDRVVLVAIGLLWVSTLAVVSGAARPRLRMTRAHFAILVFVGVCLASVAFNGHELAVNQEVTPVLKKLLLLASLVGFFVIAASVIRPREVPQFIKLVIGLGVIVAIGTIIERTTKSDPFYTFWSHIFTVQPPANLDKVDTIGRIAIDGPTAQPLELAALLAIVLPFAIVGGLEARAWRQRLLYALATTVLLAGAFATGRKTGVVAPAIGLLVIIAYRPRAMLKSIAVAGLPLLATVHLMAPGQIGSTFLELLPGHVNNSLTTRDRVVRYDAVRPDVMTHLLIGRGFESYDPVKYRILDNELLGLLIGVGAIGLVFYLAIFGALFTLGHPMIRGPDPRRSAAALGLQSALVATLVANTLFDELSFTHLSYVFFFLAAMVVALRVPTPAPVSELVPASYPNIDDALFRDGSRRERLEPTPAA